MWGNDVERLSKALELLGVTQNTPSHITHILLTNIMSLAGLNNDSELEAACKCEMLKIQQQNKSKTQELKRR